MRIGIDVDNVLSNFNDELLKEFLKHDKELRNTGIVNNNVYITKGMFDWSQQEVNEFYNNNIERIAKNLKVIDSAPEYISKLKKEGNQIYIVSGRENGDYKDPYKMTEEWLDKYNIKYDKLILTNAYSDDDKALACENNNIDIMIDDSPKILSKFDQNKIKLLLMDTVYNRDNKTITRMHNWKEIYKYISNLE